MSEDSPTRFDRFAAVAVLAALGGTWPVLDLLGRNAEFFVARRSTKVEIAALVLALALGVPVVLGALASIGGRIGRWLGEGLLALTAASLAQLYIRRLPMPWWIATTIAVAVGIAAVWAFRKFDPARMFARYLIPAPLVLAVMFVFTTPAGAVLADQGTEIGSPVDVSKPTPILFLVFDEFPVASLIDAAGNLRSDSFPAFGRLAADGTWFRNAMTVEQQTEHSVPAMLTGVVPDQSKTPYAGQYPDNLFTALQDEYELDVLETITRLCPISLCEGLGQSTTPILRDVGVVAGHVLLPEGLASTLPQIDRSWGDFGAATSEFDVVAEFRENLMADPRKPVDRLIAEIRAPRSAKTPFYFLHAVVPHHPWQFLPDGRRYPLNQERAPGSDSPGWGSDEFLVAQAMQRHLLQVGYVDHALGDILDALDAAGLYDETMIIVVADHGISVKPNVAHQRDITPTTVGEIAAVPLFVKAPGLEPGSIDDRRALTIDILPTIGDVIGAPFSWTMEGSSLLRPALDRAETTTIGPRSSATFGADGTEKLQVAARLESLFPGGDPWALLPPGAPDLLGDRVDAEGLESGGIVAEIDRKLIYTVVNTQGDVIPARVTGTLIGETDGTEVLAVAVNGVVGAMTRSFIEEDVTKFQAMVPPELFVDGDNRIDIMVVRNGDLFRVEVVN